MRWLRGLTLAGLFFASGFLIVLMGTYLWMAFNGWPTVEIEANAFREGYLELVMVGVATWTLGLVTATQLQEAAREDEGEDEEAPPELAEDDLQTPIVEEA